MPDSLPDHSARMSIAEWDGYIGGLADAPEFILGDKFECAEGQALARILADHSWPLYARDRTYAKAGDNSNAALRSLERKYHAALKLLDRLTPDETLARMDRDAD